MMTVPGNVARQRQLPEVRKRNEKIVQETETLISNMETAFQSPGETAEKKTGLAATVNNKHHVLNG